MNRKIISLIAIFVIIFQTFWSSLVYAETKNANEQPAVCNWPTEMMDNYFTFQQEAVSILLWSRLNERRFSVKLKEWLFKNQVLQLHATSALDLLASNVLGSMKSWISNSITSVVLLLLSSASILQSNTEGLAILFKDRPIVRDYKEMLDIETQLFDVAFFRSKQIDLTRPFEDDELFEKFKKLIEEYESKWLLEGWNELDKNTSMANIILELISMNTVMKRFIMYPDSIWKQALTNYAWCFWNNKWCKRGNAVLKFSPKAIDTLHDDYKGIWTFGDCNLSFSDFKKSISKSVTNNKKKITSSFDDVKEAMKRLKWALIWTNEWKARKDKCDMTDYEMAQLSAYWWSNWTCWELVKFESNIGGFKDYFKNKKSQNSQKNKMKTVLKSSNEWVWNSKGGDEVMKWLNSTQSSVERSSEWYKYYGNTPMYTQRFSSSLNDSFQWILTDNLEDFRQSQENAIGGDFSRELIKIKWLLNQIKAVMSASQTLKVDLQNVADNQCPN